MTPRSHILHTNATCSPSCKPLDYFKIRAVTNLNTIQWLINFKLHTYSSCPPSFLPLFSFPFSSLRSEDLLSSSMAAKPPLRSPAAARLSTAPSAAKPFRSPCAASPRRSAHSVAVFCAGAAGNNPTSSDGVVSKGSALGSSNGASVFSDASSAIDFLTLCHRLKTTKRKGWVNHGIKGPESIADHMYRMSLMALIASNLPDIDRERCIKIAIVHDIAEAIVGDITPSDGVPKAEKSRREKEALDKMCEILGGGLRADEIKELWAEYENNSSMEASIVKDFDKVEMILQALEYETEHGKILDEFFLSTAGKFQTAIGKSWAAEVVRRRNNTPGKRF